MRYITKEFFDAMQFFRGGIGQRKTYEQFLENLEDWELLFHGKGETRTPNMKIFEGLQVYEQVYERLEGQIFDTIYAASEEASRERFSEGIQGLGDFVLHDAVVTRIEARKKWLGFYFSCGFMML